MTSKLTTPDLITYIRRCELLDLTDHPNYTAACDELSRRRAASSSQEA